MDFDATGVEITLECPDKEHREQSKARFFIPVDGDTWPTCPVCGKELKRSRSQRR